MYFWVFILSDSCKWNIFSLRSWAEMKMTYPTMFKIAPYYIRAAVREMTTKQAWSLL